MWKTTRYVGLDVHADGVAVAVTGAEGEVRSVGRIPNRIESIRSDPEAPTPGGAEGLLRGYALRLRLAAVDRAGMDCEAVAPMLLWSSPGTV